MMNNLNYSPELFDSGQKAAGTLVADEVGHVVLRLGGVVRIHAGQAPGGCDAVVGLHGRAHEDRAALPQHSSFVRI